MIDENKFWEVLGTWEYQTKALSSSTKILSHPAMNEIIQMGWDAVPLILKAMKDGSLFHLSFTLHKITGEWPVKDEYRGNGHKIIECWMQWARKHGYQI